MDSRKELMVVIERNRVAFILRLEKDGTETDVAPCGPGQKGS